jgi:hypothetical protein
MKILSFIQVLFAGCHCIGNTSLGPSSTACLVLHRKACKGFFQDEFDDLVEER